MLQVSDALRRIRPPATIAATGKARDMRAAGRDIVTLSIGEPDFDTPVHIKEAACAAIRRGRLGYPPVSGIPELRIAVSEKFRRENGVDYEPKEIIVCSGSKQVIACAFLATLDSGDEVIVPAPYWVSYPDMASMFGGTPKFVQTRPADGFKLRAADLEAAIGPRTRWLVLNSPNNPTGATYTRADYRELTDVLLRHPHVMLMTDDIYEHLVYGDEPFVTPLAVEPRLKDRTLTINGVSKAYSMTGWRIGYGGGPAALISAMDKAQSQLTGGASVPAQWAAIAALTGDQSHLAARQDSFRARRDLVVSLLNRAPGLDCATPSGAFYVFPSCEGLVGRKTPGGRTIATSADFADALLEDEGVAVVAGEGFGFAGHVRVSYAAADDVLREGCSRIRRFCESLTSGY
ncbi:pyridoxal phosphate-dependent aminotransferase [Rhodoplanes roseus]|uniref:Aminotransferase n=1 Tax=Rhodoplanes roseus TaxID=29409 RepID=A0A327KR51_9BRAD|nr:pyridoxal phosphate-dependent aminotransferase [Rhodoplanes roseus]RAI41420.1 aspartate aminotransferase [Rhodoplanes roseus]